MQHRYRPLPANSSGPGETLRFAPDTAAGINPAHRLREAANRQPAALAVVAPVGPRFRRRYRQVTFRWLEDRSNAYACGLLEQGFAPGMRVLLLVEPGCEFVALWFALLKIGSVPVLIDPGMGAGSFRRCVADARPDRALGPTLIARLLRTASGAPIPRCCSPGRCLSRSPQPVAIHETEDPSQPAAILFTTGSTGIPKGVPYTAAALNRQLELLGEAYRIGAGDVGFAAFVPFALYCVGLGTTAVIPAINRRKPARANPAAMAKLLQESKATYSFGSPAFFEPLARWAQSRGVRFSDLRSVVMFGAPVSPEVHALLARVLPADAQTHTPYGATEGLPLTTISGAEILRETAAATAAGRGVCVGRPLPGVELKIIAATAAPLERAADCRVLGQGELGEIIARGDNVSRQYLNRPQEQHLAKIADGETVWHRMGDVGYLDTEGRLWFCGRKNHCVQAAGQTLYSVCCEGIVDCHPAVKRSALVGARTGSSSDIEPVICIEPKANTCISRRELIASVRRYAAEFPETAAIRHFLVHASFPVDIRHNAKIIREDLAQWAEAILRRRAHSLVPGSARFGKGAAAGK